MDAQRRPSREEFAKKFFDFSIKLLYNIYRKNEREEKKYYENSLIISLISMYPLFPLSTL